MIAAVILTGALLFNAQAAVDVATKQAESLGYQPCQAEVVDAASQWGPVNGTNDVMPENVAGWAAWPEVWGVCQIGITPETAADADFLDDVARHEVCHLAVGVAIDANPDNYKLDDRHHEATDFKDCMAGIDLVAQEESQVVGVNSAPPGTAEAEPTIEPTISVGNGGTTGIAEYEAILNGPTNEDYENCLALQEVKTWIDWECGNYLPATQGA